MKSIGVSSLSLLALICILLPFSVSAAPPQMGAGYNYDGWAVLNGTIDSSSSCTDVGVTSCKTLSQDDGFLQEEVFLDNGEHYIRVLLTEHGATDNPSLTGALADLDFATEGYTTFLSHS